MPDQLVKAAQAEFAKAERRVKEAQATLETVVADALKAKRITPKEATELRARFRGKK